MPSPLQTLLPSARRIIMVPVMKRLMLLLALLSATWILATGCKSDPGSREYIPGKGWRPV
jgi:hypothetical protein